MIPEDIGTAIRHGLTTLAGILLASGPLPKLLAGAGVTTDQAVSGVVGFAMIVVALVWSGIKSRNTVSA